MIILIKYNKFNYLNNNLLTSICKMIIHLKNLNYQIKNKKIYKFYLINH